MLFPLNPDFRQIRVKLIIFLETNSSPLAKVLILTIAIFSVWVPSRHPYNLTTKTMRKLCFFQNPKPLSFSTNLQPLTNVVLT